MQSFLHGIGEMVMPVLRESKFHDTGRITPEEFIVAGDYLVHKFPSWQWSPAASKALFRPFLPEHKQFLVTRNVPSYRRVNEYAGSHIVTADDVPQLMMSSGNNNGDNWTSLSLNDDRDETNSSSIGKRPTSSQFDDIPDMEELMEQNDDLIQEIDDPSAVRSHESKSGGNLLSNRSYDIHITYDKYYQTPRMWLYGYNEDNRPLKADQIFEDISQDHARKTATFEQHPHLPYSMVSIHPCKHADVIQAIINRLQKTSNQQEAISVELYLLIFLKFMSSVVPTIDYDQTNSVKAT